MPPEADATRVSPAMRWLTVVAPPGVAMGVAGRAKLAAGWVPGMVGWFTVPPDPFVAGANVA